jgi:hypothetical protein
VKIKQIGEFQGPFLAKSVTKEGKILAKSVVKEWKNDLSNMNKAIYAAVHFAKKNGKDMVVVPHVSYMKKIFTIEAVDGSLKKYAIFNDVNVIFVNQEGMAAEAIASP